MTTSSTKPYPGITGSAIVFVVTKDTYSCSWEGPYITLGIEAFSVTASLQRCRRTNKVVPRVATQWYVAVTTISDQWEQRVGLLVYNNKPGLLSDSHSKTYLRERRIPVSRQFGFLSIKPSLAPLKIVCNSVAPKVRIKVERSLKCKTKATKVVIFSRKQLNSRELNNPRLKPSMFFQVGCGGVHDCEPVERAWGSVPPIHPFNLA